MEVETVKDQNPEQLVISKVLSFKCKLTTFCFISEFLAWICCPFMAFVLGTFCQFYPWNSIFGKCESFKDSLLEQFCITHCLIPTINCKPHSIYNGNDITKQTYWKNQDNIVFKLTNVRRNTSL